MTTQWDFRTDVDELLASTSQGGGPRRMSEMVTAANEIAAVGRSDPDAFRTWLFAHAEPLIGQQILVTSVQAQSAPETELPRVLGEWAAIADAPTAASALEWLKEEYPGLLRAWLLTKVEELLAAELAER